MTTRARIVAWWRARFGFSQDQYPDNRHRPPSPPRWVDVPVRELTADELRDDPRQARVVRRRWLERQP